MSFSETLNSYLNQVELSYYKFAKYIGISASAMKRYVSGEREPAYDSEQLYKIAGGIYRLALKKGINLSEEEVLSSLRSSLKDSLNIDYEAYIANLNALIRALDIRVSVLARILSFDASHISKILSGQRRPGQINDFTQKIALVIAHRYADDDSIKAIASLTGLSENQLSSQRAINNAVVLWLGTNTATAFSNPVVHFLDKIEEFSLDKFINTIHFNDIKLPTVLFQLPTTKTYSTLNGMKKCEIDFIKATLVSKSMSDCVIYSNMPMEEMAEDEDFAKKWMFGMAMMLKKGLHLNLIHDVYRPFNEMMLGLESNIPMYMTGQISPWYLPVRQSGPINYLLKVSGAAAMEGVAISGHHADCRYTLSKSDEDIRYYRKKAEHLLEKAQPLMDIYRSDRKAAFAKARVESWQGGDRLTVASALPLFTLSAEALKAILDRNRITEKDANEIEEYRVELLKTVTDYLKNNKFTIVVPFHSREQFESAPIHLALSELFYEKEIAYTYDEYIAHLALTEAFSKKYPNLTVEKDSSPAFRNITYSVVQNRMVIVTKNKYPTIHFVIHHKKMIQAFQNFTPPVTEI